MMERGFFITGTDTGVGKTWITVALLHLLQTKGREVVGMKPVASGCQQTSAGLRNSDALLLQQAASLQLPYELINPFAFQPPTAPHIAADEAGRLINFERIHQCYQTLLKQADYVLVEGVGGWSVPLAGQQKVSDLAISLNLPIILVVGLRLGCLNHALLTYQAIKLSGLNCLGWIANQVESDFDYIEEYMQSLQTELEVPCLGQVPFMKELDADKIMNYFGGVMGELDEY